MYACCCRDSRYERISAGVMLKGHKADLFPTLFPVFFSNSRTLSSVWCSLKHCLWLWLVEDVPRRSDDEFVLERMRFTLLESGNGKACMLNVLNLWITTYAVFPCSVCYWILFWPMNANGCLLLISDISRPSLFCFGFDLNQSQRTKLISRNGYGPDCLGLSTWSRLSY